MSTCSGIGNSRAAIAFNMVLLPQPFSPNKPYRRPRVSSRVASVINTRPWNTKLTLVILTSLLAAVDDRTPVVTRSDRPCLSNWSARRLTSSILSAEVAGSSDTMRFPLASNSGSSPFTDPAALAFLELALDREATVFFVSFPSARRFARRFSLDEDGAMVGFWVRGSVVGGERDIEQGSCWKTGRKIS